MPSRVGVEKSESILPQGAPDSLDPLARVPGHLDARGIPRVEASIARQLQSFECGHNVAAR
jgi:hypothetical protein